MHFSWRFCCCRDRPALRPLRNGEKRNWKLPPLGKYLGRKVHQSVYTDFVEQKKGIFEMETIAMPLPLGWWLWERISGLVHFAVRKLTPVPEKRAAAEKDSADCSAADALDRYGNAILRCAYSYLHNMADAEEILQDTLLKLLTADPSFESEEHKKAWLLRTAANLSKNRIEYNALRSSDELSDELAEEGREDLSFVWDAVKDLPVQFREVIHLHYYEGYSTEEIARLLDRNPSTVRSDLRRGREKLKAVLKEAYDFEV